MAPGLTFTIDFRLAFFLREGTTEIEDRDSVELDEIIGIDIVRTIRQTESVFMVVLGIPG
jgi:phosphatidylglycerophosphatase A